MRNVSLSLPLLTPEGYASMGIDYDDVVSDIQDGSKWLCLAHAAIINNEAHRQTMGEDFYGSDLLASIKEFEKSFSRLKVALGDHRKREIAFDRSERDEKDGIKKNKQKSRSLVETLQAE